MANEFETYLWGELANAPKGPGVYAWYYSPEITDFDLDQTIEAVRTAASRIEAECIIRSMLDERLFRYFREAPYSVDLTGPLKPTFSGLLQHDTNISTSLVERLAENPERLYSIRQVLTRSAPMFASPLYIGMAQILRERLAQHKRFIERYRKELFENSLTIELSDEKSEMSSDAGFARQIAIRKIPPERLIVFTCSISSIHDIVSDVENILNRICYPILGRN